MVTLLGVDVLMVLVFHVAKAPVNRLVVRVKQGGMGKLPGSKSTPVEETLGEGKGKVVPVIRRLPKYRTRPPFTRNSKHPKAEFDRQIQAQQDGLNQMTVEDYLKNRDQYNKQGRTGDKAQQNARNNALKRKTEELSRQGKGPQQAKAEAETWIKKQDALHNPDQIAGGNPDHIGGMGDRGVNRSIGSQWEKKGISKGMDEHIREKAKTMTPEERRTTKLGIELDH